MGVSAKRNPLGIRSHIPAASHDLVRIRGRDVVDCLSVTVPTISLPGVCVPFSTPACGTKRLAGRMAAGRGLEGGWQAAAGSQAVVTKPGDKKNSVLGENRRWSTEKVTNVRMCSEAN